ncbi:MAG: hypothetical protein UV74_C0013G0375 [Candidatus Woesebacteria bacterium GW2011_GWB1_43_14]|uniref:Glycosyltransferase RgtA/B/C/D-like domain-containing protein n=1 Tax=Candidatus Woesebacteria bacterium GW2011_GWB1_43_14 TaxID=1618578 RepID=A0A0G1GEG0_9BACT|nr:MAG: hypothetical protein UT21_C0001G0085 [Candidatus Woesebacteria bacterium GW2011_GWA1_39_11b]KKS78329.1 MAG: hypothetical protein UV51_C0001G0045 [Candidatus Woesebacteria bacterium GW2011_GWC1_42_9]KKS97253.1 MAG: hypothetical protein UV74_C0013G0375 [Candidatus Woesebacteria bacterium GW2011_GWB1_43_14]
MKVKYCKLVLILIIFIASFLRLWRLDQVPVSLFGDELDVGYHAYSIFKTGKDYMGNPWPLHFQSLAEWRTPLYLYSTVPTVALFGVSPWGVRLPAAIFGILGVYIFFFLLKELTKNEKLSLIGTAVLAFSPWHIQYSRSAFEVTQLLFFLLLGMLLFFKSFNNGKWLWLSMVSFALMPWVYSTAKLFTPLILVFLFLVWRKKLFGLPKKYLIRGAVALLIFGVPIAYSTIFGGGSQRFGYISVFTNPTTEAEVGTSRQLDARMRGELGEGLHPTFIDRAFHNKFTFWGSNIVNNYFESFSADFLFNVGDPNLRHSINGMGLFYKIEIVAFFVGLIYFFSRNKIDKKIRLLVLYWIIIGVLPASITRDGGHHATRLIVILPPMVILIAYGIHNFNKYVLLSYFFLFIACFIFYQHSFWVHNPWGSERWWHAGFRESVQSIKEIENGYEKIIISTSSEPPWTFFAAWYEYPPDKWQSEFPLDNVVNLEGVGNVSHIDKYYFGSVKGGLYDWGKILDGNTLYLASEKDVNVNLIMEPDRTPGDLKLIKSIPYPSGQPAFYLFSGKSE